LCFHCEYSEFFTNFALKWAKFEQKYVGFLLIPDGQSKKQIDVKEPYFQNHHLLAEIGDIDLGMGNLM